MVTRGGGGAKIVNLAVTSFLNGPYYTFFSFIRNWSIRKWGYRGQKNKKVEGQNAPNLRKWPYTSFISFGNLTFRNALFTLLKNKY